MIVEDVRIHPPGEVIEVDLCIVGSGFAGLTLALEFNGTKWKVLVLESGGLVPDAFADDLNRIESIGAKRVMDQTLLRNRIFGGSSSTWGGRVAAFDEEDYLERDWVAHSGWPFSRQDCEPYFARAASYLDCRIPDNKVIPGIVPPQDQLPFDGALLNGYFWNYSSNDKGLIRATRMGPKALSPGRAGRIGALVNATVTQIELNESGNHVESLEITGPDGFRRRVKSRLTVLCGGAIENARMLLASNRVRHGGVGNERDLVGRFLMDHPRGRVGRFDEEDSLAVQRRFNNFRLRIGGRPATTTYGIVLSHAVQRAEQLLNCSAWVVGIPLDSDPWVSVKRLTRPRGWTVATLRSVLNNPGLTAESVYRFLIARRAPVHRMSTLTIEFMVEQCPDRDSRITLADAVDAYGTPLSRIDWRVGEQEIRTVRRMGELVASEFARLGLPEPLYDDFMAPDSPDFPLPDVAHPMGTTRMASSPDAGVVDANGAVHGVEGLFIAGSSVFPTGGHANPTQMIVTLSVRLADHLKQVLAQLENHSGPRQSAQVIA